MAGKPNVRDAENAVRDLKNWIMVFAKEYDLADEAVAKLNEQVEKVAAKIADIK